MITMKINNLSGNSLLEQGEQRMTKEELEKEANKFADENATPDLDYSFRVDIFEASKEGYLAGAEPREKRIADLEDKLANADYQFEGRDLEIKELKAQIEKLIDFVLSKTECCDVCPMTDTCINSEGTCHYAGILAKGEEEVTREWLMQKITKEIKEK